MTLVHLQIAVSVLILTVNLAQLHHARKIEKGKDAQAQGQQEATSSDRERA